MAKATAMQNGIKAAIQAGFTDIQIEGDNRILMQAVQRKIQVPWKIQVLVQDITTFLDSFNKVIINYIFIQGNSVANWMAKFGLSIHSTNVWNVVPPRDLCRVLFEDNLVRTLNRRAS